MEIAPARMSGRALAALLFAVRHTPARLALSRVLRAQLGIEALRALPGDLRGDLAVAFTPLRARTERHREDAGLGMPVRREWPLTTAALAAAYRDRRATPQEVAERALAGARRLGAEGPGGSAILEYDDSRALAAARASAERLARGEALGVLDGVPVAIKEEVDVAGLPTRTGTSWLPRTPATADAAAVARLRAAGAVILGTTPMTEYGLSPLGGNANRDMPRNAHDPGRLPGGSSSGSGVAVASGIVPVALGADGGGSIRIPACLNGVFGLKPTYGRVPVTGEGLKGGSSVVHLGPLGASAHDLAVFTEAVEGPDGHDRAADAQLPLAKGELVAALGRGVRGLRVGIDEDEWAAAETHVSAPGRQALAALEKEGATLVPVRMRMARYAPAIGYLTIGLESFSGLLEARASHMDELGPDVQMLMAGMDTFRSDDYLDAQRLRATLRREVADVLGEVDVIALPTTARAAPPVNDDEARHGFIDPPALDAMCRFAFLGNLTGCPAGTAPVGTDRDGLSVGLQIVADAWDEATVLQVLAHLERIGAASVTRPRRSVDLL